jgi:putative holliday junction resolvase
MSYIGIDYGSKRVGIAVAEEGTGLAFPLVILENDEDLIHRIQELAKTRNTNQIILGESRNYHGEGNEIMIKIKEFKNKLEKEGFEVHMEPEFMTSAQAVHIQGENKMLDASAAAIILQSYLDRQR